MPRKRPSHLYFLFGSYIEQVLANQIMLHPLIKEILLTPNSYLSVIPGKVNHCKPKVFPEINIVIDPYIDETQNKMYVNILVIIIVEK